MNFQIDVKPSDAEKKGHPVILYINGNCYNLFASNENVLYMIIDGLIDQVKGTRHVGGTDKLETFDYPEGVDSAGVKYTSKSYKLTQEELPF